MNKTKIINAFRFIISKLSDLIFGKTIEKQRFCIDVSDNGRQAINRLVEMSGVRDVSELLILSFSVLEKLLDHTLNDGKIYLYEKNEVNKEELELLDDIERLREMIKKRKNTD